MSSEQPAAATEAQKITLLLVLAGLICILVTIAGLFLLFEPVLVPLLGGPARTDRPFVAVSLKRPAEAPPESYEAPTPDEKHLLVMYAADARRKAAYPLSGMYERGGPRRWRATRYLPRSDLLLFNGGRLLVRLEEGALVCLDRGEAVARLEVGTLAGGRAPRHGAYRVRTDPDAGRLEVLFRDRWVLIDVATGKVVSQVRLGWMLGLAVVLIVVGLLLIGRALVGKREA